MKTVQVQCGNAGCKRHTNVEVCDDEVATGRAMYVCPGCNRMQGFNPNARPNAPLRGAEGEPVKALPFDEEAARKHNKGH